MFIITIKSIKLNKETKKLDHGFVDLKMFDVAKGKYEVEEEVLLNALNVYKVTDVVT